MLIVAIFVLSLLPVFALADESPIPGHTNHDDWTQWTNSAILPSEDGKYVLMNDINMSMPVVLEDKEITICLNGKTVKQVGEGEYERFYRINGSTMVTICDCTAHVDASGKYVAGVMTGGTNSAFLFDSDSSATLTIYDGILTGNSAAAGGCIVVQGKSYFNMYGGEISNNRARNGNGGAIYASGTTTVTILGGTISGNSATKAEGVSRGGGIFTSAGSCTLQGVTITGNSADQGAGVFVNNGTVNMDDGTVISGNTAAIDGGGIRLGNKDDSHNPVFLMQGGEITGNVADTGGALCMGTGSEVKLIGGAVKGNTAATGVGGILAAGTLTLGNLAVTQNVGGTAGGVHFLQGTVKFDGAPVIVDNTLTDGTTCNFLYEAREEGSMSLLGVTSGAKIGVTLVSGLPGISATGANEENAAYFFSDNVEGKSWYATPNGLELGKAPDPTEPPITEPATEATEPKSEDTDPDKPEGVSPVIWVAVAVAVAGAVGTALVLKKKK